MNTSKPYRYIIWIIFIILVSFANADEIANYSNPGIRLFNTSNEKHTQTSGLSFGMGAGSIDYLFPILNGALFFSLNESLLMAVRYMNLQEFVINFSGSIKDTGSINEFGLLAGAYENNKHTFASISGGFGLVSGNITRRDPDDKPRKWGEPTGIIFSIPLEIQLILKPIQSIGIGVIGFANVNTNASYYGILICINLFTQ